MTTHRNLLSFGRRLCGVAAVFSLTVTLSAQPTGDSPLTPPPNGPRDARTTWHAITGATVHVSPERHLEDASVLIREGRIWRVESGVRAERLDLTGYRVWDGEGLHVYAGFIDAFVEVEAPGVDPDGPGVHWNTKVTPQRRATAGDGVPESTASGRRKLGFAAGHIAPASGIFRGRSAVVSLAARASEASVDRPPVYAEDVTNVLTLASGGWGGGYPTSRVGTIALIRQTLSDADWQLHERRIGEQLATNAIDVLASTDRPLLFDVDNELEVLRASAIADEFGRPAIVVGSGTSYRRLDAIADTGRQLIVPLRFAAKPEVSSIGAADAVDLGTLMAWEQDPTNLRRLNGAGVTTAITASKLSRGDNFHANLRKAVAHGLGESAALAALTTVPADMLGVDAVLGTVEKDKIANLVVADGPIFHEGTKIRDVWVDGRRHEVNAAPGPDVSGTWAFGFEGAPDRGGSLVITKSGSRYSVTLKSEGRKDVKARNVKLSGNRLSYLVDMPEEESTVIVTAVIEGDEMTGSVLVGTDQMTWTGERLPSADPQGAWRAVEMQGEMVDAADPDAPVVEVKGESVTLTLFGVEVEGTDVKIEDGGKLAFSFDGAEVGLEGPVHVRATVQGDEMSTVAEMPDGFEHMSLFARQDREDGAREDSDEHGDVPEALGYPFGAYMVESIPPQQDVVIKNATIWTSGPQGVIEKGWVRYSDGKIVDVRSGAFDGRADLVIDASGKHVTPGLIDCHSHTGTWTGGTNEGGQAVTSEVRMQDTTDPDPVNWYRQLAGGTTTVNTLHGSANPIGGQNVVQKVRWGAVHPNDMHFEGAMPGIKFALGENVKRTRSRDSTRYPRTRMGVETLIRDRFEAARDYAEAWSDWRAQIARASSKPPAPALPPGGIAEVIRTRTPANFTVNTGSDLPRPRRDLELEALAEILAGERLIHCHSYRQDEILMLCRVAEDFGFTIGTFQHVLEGYKVAEAIKAHAIGGSSFSDWWAFKVEVQDAIPYNGAIMHDVGVVVSFNSDSDELARRMNTEAAKAVRYGGVPPAEALKFVTINAAKQLMIEDRVGSLEAGKDADIVIWSGDPLSTLSRAEYVAIDGREYFSLERDEAFRERIASERGRLIQKILAKGRKGGGKKDQKADGPAAEEEPTDPFEAMYLNAIREYALDLYLSGQDPDTMFSQGCGVSLLEYLEGSQYRLLQGLDRALGTHDHNHR